MNLKNSVLKIFKYMTRKIIIDKSGFLADAVLFQICEEMSCSIHMQMCLDFFLCSVSLDSDFSTFSILAFPTE